MKTFLLCTALFCRPGNPELAQAALIPPQKPFNSHFDTKKSQEPAIYFYIFFIYVRVEIKTVEY
jgi:hypothetical protein